MTENENLRILLIEDDVESGESMKLILQRRNVDVLLVSSGEEGIKRFNPQEQDAVVSDIRLLGMSGVDVLRHIRSKDRFFPVILLTGYDSIESAIVALQEGAQDYILKPLDSIDQLLKPVQTAVTNYRLHLEHQRLERELEISERRFRKVYENAAVGVALLDADARFLQANQTALACFAQNETNLTGTSLYHLIPDAHERKQIEKRFRECTLEKESITDPPLETRTKRGPDGKTFWCQWHLSRFDQDENDHPRMLAFIIDVDEKKKLEQNLVKHREGLFQAEKLAAIGKMAGGIAHDFNNIVYIINGNLRIALEHSDPASPEHARLVNALAACESAVDLTDRIRMTMDATKTETRPLNLQSLITQTLDILSFRIPPAVKVQIEWNQPDAVVQGDRLELQQVFMNLFLNAVQAMKKGGDLAVIQGILNVEQRAAERLHLPEPGLYSCLSINDTGTGISEDHLLRIFEPFFSTKRKEGCSGLGLSLAYGIIKAHGGAIEVNSVENEGTTFTVYLPCVMQKTATPSGEEAVPRGNESILIVDDDPHVLETTGHWLRQLGYRTTCFSHCKDCLEDFRIHHDRYDMAIIDFVMPEMTGGQLSRELLNFRKDLPIVILTAFSYSVTAGHNRGSGIYKYISKSITPAELARTIHYVLNRTTNVETKPTDEGKSVLLIDDDNEARKLLRDVLEEASYRVIEAQNGRIGLEKFMAYHVDLVLTDIFMPEKDGLEVILEFKKNQPDIKIFAYTGGNAKIGWDCLAQAIPLGADFTFQRPMDNKLLLDKIYEHLHGSARATPETH